MNKNKQSRNYQLCEELDIAGSFLYDGLKVLDNMDYPSTNQDVFMFLYSISVGIERLLKLVFYLIDDSLADTIDADPSEIKNAVEIFNKKVKHHDHERLIQSIRSHRAFPLSKEQNKFFKLLNIFYNSKRYKRLAWVDIGSDEQSLLESFLKENLDDQIQLKRHHFGLTDGSKIFLTKIIKKSQLNFMNK